MFLQKVTKFPFPGVISYGTLVKIHAYEDDLNIPRLNQVNLGFGILQFKVIYMVRKLWLSEVIICEKVKTSCPHLFSVSFL